MDTNDVAQIPVLEGLVDLFAEHAFVKVDLNPTGGILQGRKARLAHHSLKHHSPGDDCGVVFLFKLLFGAAIVKVQHGCAMCWLEVIGISDTLFAQARKLMPTLGNQVVFIVSGGLVVSISHD